MALTIELGVAELAATRFAISPLSETVACLQQLGGQDRRPATRPWLRWAQDQLASQPLDLSWTWPLIVSTRPAWPEFLVPAPPRANTTIDAELEALQRTPARQVKVSLTRVFGAKLPPAVADLADQPEAGLHMIAAELRTAYQRLVASHWPRIQAILDADITYRTRQLAIGGAEKLFKGLHPDVRWRDGQLMLVGQRWPADHTVHRGPGGLVLMPVALGPPHVLVKKRTSTQTTVRYPARGVAAIWAAGNKPPSDAAVRLIGRAKTQILELLRTPGTTSELARTLQISPSAVSQHIAVMHDCGLLERQRTGRTVLYRTTDAGTALLQKHGRNDPAPTLDCRSVAS